MTFHVRTELFSLIIEKGYVCLDGVSLTVTNVNTATSEFSIMMIAYTQTKVALAKKVVGDDVNLEVDQMGKYIESQMANMLGNTNGTVYKMVEQMVKQMVKNKL